ncbi:MAG: radical SAM protein [Candidatus Hodarchaeota archaeon]
MTITSLHLLQTYQCTFECDHCFVCSRPDAEGAMTIADIHHILAEAKLAGSINSIYFEGGEPFLYYQTMLWGLRAATKQGFQTGIVTNAYWALSVEDAIEWLKPIHEIGISDLSISDDAYHYGEQEENLAKNALNAAQKLGLPVDTIVIEDPRNVQGPMNLKGEPVVGGRVLCKGRAATKVIEGLPTKPWSSFTECKAEDFAHQGRVHIDPFGYVHVCQGISIGNIKKTPLTRIIADFDAIKHPVCGPILKGGPVELVQKYGVDHEDNYVDECHLCYAARLKLKPKFPEILAPDQVYDC